MDITHTDLLRFARDFVKKGVLSDPGLVAAYLTGSARTDNPFLGNTTDIDIVFVHNGEPKIRREIVPLTPEIHLDVVHNPRKLYEKPKELRVHPWLGPELYDPLLLYATGHFFEFIQAGVRGMYHESANVQARSHRLAEAARQVVRKLLAMQSYGLQQVLDYLGSVYLGANAIAALTGNLLTERRFLLQFPAYAGTAGHPDLAEDLSSLLGANRVDEAALAGFLPEWESTFIEAVGNPAVQTNISSIRLGYYKQAFNAMLASETPQAMLWPLMFTWTQAVSVLPTLSNTRWRSACATLGLDEGSFGERLVEMGLFLDAVETIQESLTTLQDQ